MNAQIAAKALSKLIGLPISTCSVSAWLLGAETVIMVRVDGSALSMLRNVPTEYEGYRVVVRERSENYANAG